MEVVIPVMDLDFNRARSPPYLTAPPPPKRFGEYYCSAPTSPRNLSEFYRDFDHDVSVTSSASAVPLGWEENPGTPKSPQPKTRYEEEFAFDVKGESERTTLPAEELFAGGKIRQLKPPPQVQLRTRQGESETRKSPATSPRSQISNFLGAFSPRKKKEFDPFATAVEKTRERTEHDRGRERVSSLSSSSSGRREARSLSPYRDSNTTSSKSGSRKWRLKDFFLFRSASEGRAADRDPLKKYTALFKKQEDDKNPRFRSIEGSNSGSRPKRKGPVSAHELHYTVNRAVSEDLKKKTFLPYKQGILGRLAFNPAVHALANGFGISRK